MVDGAEVGVYGTGAYGELLGYLGVGHPSCDEPQDLDLGAEARRVGGGRRLLRCWRTFQGVLMPALGAWSVLRPYLYPMTLRSIVSVRKRYVRRCHRCDDTAARCI